MEKNETYQVTCTGYNIDGLGVARIDDFVVFVHGLIEGEEALIALTKIKKHFAYGRIVEVISPSPHRMQAKCDVYRLCGGCQIQHMDTFEQHRFKEEKVRMCFRQNANMEVDVLPIIATPEEWNYRNKVQVPVQFNNGQIQMGFYQNHTNKIIDYKTCYVQSALSNAITLEVKELLDQYHCAKTMRHVLVKHSHTLNQVMVVFVVRDYPFHNQDQVVEALLKNHPEIKSIIAIENRREDNVILDGKEHTLYGNSYIEEELLGNTFRISARSFYQINPYTTPLLYQTAIDYAGLTGKETLIDLYCGTGTIGMIASKHAKRVYGIEIVKEAIEDANINAQNNNITNISFINADASEGAKRIVKSKIKPDVIIVDPPRKGCSKDTLDAIITMSPQRLVYVSCDPATLARDVKYMQENNYKLEVVQPFDMFPNTLHVETVVLLSRK